MEFRNIKFGIHVSVQSPLNTNVYQKFQESLEYVRIADKYGFDAVFCGQHYLTYPYTMLQIIPFLSRMMAESKRLFFGTGVLLLALYNPVDVAETIASMDIISGGRFIFGVGLGYREEEYNAFGISKEDAPKRFNECLAIVKMLWTQDIVNFEGKYFKLKNVSLAIKPLQKPYPPIWIGATNNKAVEKVGKLGHVWYASNLGTINMLRKQMEIYLNILKKYNHPEPLYKPVLRELFISEDSEKAYRMAEPVAEKYKVYHQWGFDKILPPEERFDRDIATLVRNRFIIGNPDQCIEQLSKLINIGFNFLIFRIYWPHSKHEDVLNTLKLVGEKVIPYFNDFN